MSARLRALADMVTPGNTVADIGCDHGFLSVYLIQAGISPGVVASDVREGPLSAARKHVEERGLSAYIETRLSDGLTEFRRGEAQTLVCAGMGGRLMQRILMQSFDVTMSFRELILQPQSELWQFRVFLRENGFSVLDENILCEDGKYYFLFRVSPGRQAGDSGAETDGEPGRRTDSDREPERGMNPGGDAESVRLGDKYGALLLRERHPVLREYLEKSLGTCRDVQKKLLAHRGAEGENPRLEQSLSENRAEMADLQAALALFVTQNRAKAFEQI